jgi:hypothetical protein
MFRPTRRLTGRSIAASAVVFAGLLLGGCFNYESSEFTTNQDVVLRASQADDARITARVPKGTPVERLGWVGGECVCWLVATPYGIGFVYTRFLDLHLADIGP